MDWTFETYTEEPAAPAAVEREHLPEGEYDFEIKLAEEDEKRISLRLAPITKGRYGWVFCDLPKGKGWATKIAAGLPVALGLTADEWAEITPKDLEGRRVRARVYQKVGNSGRLFVNVRDFLRPADPPPKPAAPAPGPEDDIPF